MAIFGCKAYDAIRNVKASFITLVGTLWWISQWFAIDRYITTIFSKTNRNYVIESSMLQILAQCTINVENFLYIRFARRLFILAPTQQKKSNYKICLPLEDVFPNDYHKTEKTS